jgi:uncharacterized integral membrane protein
VGYPSAMRPDDQNELLPESGVGDRTPIVDEEPSTRRKQLATVFGGTLVGLVVGALLVVLIDRQNSTGSSGNIETWLFGLPILLAIAGTVIGSVLAGMRNVDDVDAPVRLRRFARRGRAATSVKGQLPGSDVPPRYEPEPTDTKPNHPSQ